MSAESEELRKLARFCTPRDRAAMEAQADRLESGQAHPLITASAAPLWGEYEEMPDLGTGGTKLVGLCPACAEQGRDSNLRHLVIYPNGKFGCAAYPALAIETPARAAHLQRVWQLVGKSVRLTKPEPLPPLILKRRNKLQADVAEIWQRAREQYAMTLAEWQASSAELPTSAEGCFLAYCGIWKPGETAWIGDRYDCTAAFRGHLFQPATQAGRGWEMCQSDGCDHASGMIWTTNAKGRGKENQIGRVFVPVEHDEEPIEQQVALARYLEAECGLTILMAVHTTNRGFHTFFDARSLPKEMHAKIAFFLASIGADYGAFQRGSTRTPGALRQNRFDGKPFGSAQPIIYIQHRT